MSFIDELKRRKVFRVGIAYAVTAWVLLQVADIATESFAAPDWVMKTLFTVLLLGFFAALALAWAFQLTGHGLERDRGAATPVSAPPSTGARWQALLFVALVAVIAYLLYDKFTVTGEPGAPAPSTAGSASVAVLPFVNMSASAENEYFSDGLTDTLLHKLAQVKELKVAARTSSFAFKGTNTDIRQIAETLGVGNVLEGSVQRAGDTVRITAQLIQASDGYHLWSGTFDRNLDDIFAVQDEIAAQVASALTGSLLEASAESTRDAGGTASTEAYDLYLQSRESYFEGTERSLAQSNRLLRQAVTLDPEFALAWSALAESILRHATLAGLGWDDIDVEMRAAADRGMELAPDNSITVGVKGYTLFERGQISEGRALLERALELDPNNVWALSRLADAQFSDGEFLAAVDSASRAMALDPLDFTLKSDSTFKFLQVGRIDEAMALAKAVLDHAPGSFDGLSALGNIYWRTGREAQAYRTYHELLQHHPNTYYVYTRIAKSFRDLGDFEGAERWLNRAMEINPRRGRLAMGRHCFVTGQRECAISLYRQAAADRDLDDEEEREWALNSLSSIAFLEEDWVQMLEISRELIEMNAERGSRWGTEWASLRAAYAAGQLGDFESRDRFLEPMRASIEDQFENGSRSQYTWSLKASMHAVLGEPEACAESLGRAIDLGFRDLPSLVIHGWWDGVIEHPAMREVLAGLEQANTEELVRLHEAVAELEGIAPLGRSGLPKEG